MSYYQGDFYQGDFYQGDPGLFSALRRIGGAALGMIPGTGTAVSLARLGSGTLAARARAGAMQMARRGGAAVLRHPVLSAAGAAGTIGAMGAALAVHGGTARTAMGGRMHMGRHGVMVKGRRRRMNPYNPRALRRAVRRAMSFSRMARRILHFTHPRSARGRAVFRARRKKRV